MQPKTFLILLKNSYFESLVTDMLKEAESFLWHNVEIFEAIDGNKVTDATWREHGLVWSNHRPLDNLPGVWGCFLSHWTLWNKCVQLNEPIIILEHDAKIRSKWDNNFNIDDIEILKLYHEQTKEYDTVSGHWTIGAHAYYITPKGANKLIKFVKENNAFAADVVMGDKVVDIKYDPNNCVTKTHIEYSTTRELPFSFNTNGNYICIPKYLL